MFAGFWNEFCGDSDLPVAFGLRSEFLVIGTIGVTPPFFIVAEVIGPTVAEVFAYDTSVNFDNDPQFTAGVAELTDEFTLRISIDEFEPIFTINRCPFRDYVGSFVMLIAPTVSLSGPWPAVAPHQREEVEKRLRALRSRRP